MKFSVLLLFALTLLFVSCLTDTKTETKYETNYQVDLSSIDPALTPDSVIITVNIDGKLDTIISLSGSQIADGSFDLPSIRTKEGQIIDLEYTVYVDDVVVASGSDSYDPEKKSTTPVPLVLDDEAIAELIAAQKSSSSNNSSIRMASSSSSAGSSSSIKASSTTGSSSNSAQTSSSSVDLDLADFDMAFVGASATGLENGTASSIQLKLVGPANATLPANLSYGLSFGGTATKTTDYTVVQSTVTFLKGAKVGDVLTYALTPVADNLVEGSETVALTLNATGLSLLNKNYALTLVDADSAWIEFKAASDTIPEDKGAAQNVTLKLRTNNASAVLAKAASVIVSTNAATSTATSPTHYADFGSPVTIVFPENSSNITEKNIPITPKDIAGYNLNRTIQLDMKYESGDVGVSATSHSVVIQNTDYEYFALLKKNASTSSVVLYSPDLDSLMTSPVKTNNGNFVAVAIALKKDSTGLIAMGNDGVAWSKVPTDVLWTQQSSGPPTAVTAVLDFGLCADNLMSVMVIKAGIVTMQVRGTNPDSELWGAIQAERSTGNTTFKGFEPCNGLVSGGLFVQNDPTPSIYLASYSSSNITLNTKASGMSIDITSIARIPNVSDRSNDMFFATYSFYLRWQVLSSTSSSATGLNTSNTIGTNYTGAQKLLSTPRGTLIFVTQDSLIETSNVGVRIKAVKHSLGTIADAQYIPKGKAIPTP